MSVCGQAEDDSASEEPPGAPVRDMYEAKAVSKVVRVLTVLAYLLSVSLAAILLSVYYVCVWKSPELPPANDTEGELSAQRGHPGDYYVGTDAPHFNTTGAGSNTTVSNGTVSTATTPSPANITGLPPSAPPLASTPVTPDTMNVTDVPDDVTVSTDSDVTNEPTTSEPSGT